MTDPADDTLVPPAGPLAASTSAPDEWQPLPPRARALFVVGSLSTVAIPAGAAGFLLAIIADSPAGLPAPWLAGVLGLLLGAGFGVWLGLKQYHCSFWRHDAEGLAVRRGRFWLRETRVPATRVQHLDLKRGPLQHRRDLATLVVHTAGSRNSAVSVANLDAARAERLREALSRQIGDDGDDNDYDAGK